MRYWGLLAVISAATFTTVVVLSILFPFQALAFALHPLMQTALALSSGLVLGIVITKALKIIRSDWFVAPVVFLLVSVLTVFVFTQITSVFLNQAGVLNSMFKRESFNAEAIVLIGSDYVDGSSAPRPDSLTAVKFSGPSLDLSSFLRSETHSDITGETLALSYAGIEDCAPYCELKDLSGRVHLESDEKLSPSGIFASTDFASNVVASELDLGSVGTIQITMETVKEVVENLGGVEIDVKEPIPVGGVWQSGGLKNIRYYIEPGTQLLSGEDAKWYARARWGSSNEDRVSRQLELIAAIRSQYSDYEIAVAILRSDSVRTDLTRMELIEILRVVG